jgi:hypothetical protein
MAFPTTLPVITREEMQSTMTAYIAQGYTVMMQTETSIIMVKKKELNMVWMIVGFFLCVIPMVYELIRYSRDEDKVIEIKLQPLGGTASPAIPSETEPGRPVLSDDGKSYWDGAKWQPIQS